jgi:hypothetical protein
MRNEESRIKNGQSRAPLRHNPPGGDAQFLIVNS